MAQEICVTIPMRLWARFPKHRRNHNSSWETPQFRRHDDAITRFHAVRTRMKVPVMDYELEACTPPSRRSRSLAWLAAASGLALALFMFGSPGAASPPSQDKVIVAPSASTISADRLTTGSIVPAAPVRLVDVPTSAVEHLPLPQKERHVLIVLLFACFTVMAAGGFALWKRGWQEIVQGENSDQR
ncbi:hypothetical protein [Rhizobium sp. AAP116]|uniref:hypothetical protein n=1 Tax=Rhizobium sp. AAP116 TaxID=1523429 RepID=UPI0012E22969|nr:hypothetical protein [Rhizobium sp. AAP116]